MVEPLTTTYYSFPKKFVYRKSVLEKRNQTKHYSYAQESCLSLWVKAVLNFPALSFRNWDDIRQFV